MQHSHTTTNPIVADIQRIGTAMRRAYDRIEQRIDQSLGLIDHLASGHDRVLSGREPEADARLLEAVEQFDEATGPMPTDNKRRCPDCGAELYYERPTVGGLGLPGMRDEVLPGGWTCPECEKIVEV